MDRAVSKEIRAELRILRRGSVSGKRPAEHYGAARRLLRDKIKQHDIQFAGTGLDLGQHDERDVV